MGQAALLTRRPAQAAAKEPGRAQPLRAATAAPQVVAGFGAVLDHGDGAAKARTLTMLQRHAGNAAVQRLVTAQRCGPTPCACPPEERAEREATMAPAVPVQRGLLEDVGGAVLPDWINDAIFGSKNRAKAAADKEVADAPKAVDAAKAKGEDAAVKSQAEAAKADRASVKEQQAVAAEQTKATAAVQQGAAKATQETEHRAAHLPAMGTGAAALLNPSAVAVGHPSVVSGQKQLEQSAVAAGGDKAAGTAKDVTKSSDVAKGKWNCPTVDIASMADGIPKKLLRGAAVGFSAVTGIPVEWVESFVSDVGQGVKAVAKLAGDGIKHAGAAIKEYVGPKIDAAKKWASETGDKAARKIDSAKKFIGSQLTEGKKRLVKGVGDYFDTKKQQIEKRAASLKAKADSAVAWVKDKIGPTWWGRLTGGLKSMALAVGGPLLAAVAGVVKYGPQLLDLAKQAKDKIAKGLRDAGDAALKKLAEANVAIGKWKADKKKELADAWEKAKGLIPEKHRKAAADLLAQGKAKAAGYVKAAKAWGKKQAGHVCAAVGDEAEACATQYLPDLGQDNKSSLKLVAAGELVVPLDEIGVPANLKVGRGATVEVIRIGGTPEGGTPADKGKSFQVQITGDAAVYLNKGTGKANEAKVNVDVPGVGPKVKAQSWDNLKGGNQPAAPAAGNSTKADIDAGIRGQSQLVYGFTSGKTNCQGLGGIVALLGAMGCSASLPSVWGVVGQGAVDAVFEDNLVSRQFTVAQGVQVSGEVANAAIGKLTGKAGAEVSATAKTDFKKDAQGNTKPESTLELGAKLSGEGAAEIDKGIISGISVGGSASAGVKVGLKYQPERDSIDVTSVAGEVELGLTRAGFNPSVLLRLLGQDGVAQLVSNLSGFKGDSGSIKVAASIKVSKVEDLTNALEDHFNKPETVSTASTMKLAKEKLDALPRTYSCTVAITDAVRLAGVAAEGEIRENGMTLGGKGSVTLDMVEERVLVNKKDVPLPA